MVTRVGSRVAEYGFGGVDSLTYVLMTLRRPGIKCCRTVPVP